MKRYYVGLDTDKYNKLWATTDGSELKIGNLNIVEVGWLDFWLYRIFGWKPNMGGDNDWDENGNYIGPER